MAATHVIIVNYNAGDWLAKAVASALAFSNGHVTVVDNASTDQSIAGVKRLFKDEERLQWIENSDNRGFAAANNQILSDLQADYAVLMNPDSEINAESLPFILAAFSQHPNMGLASCQILNQDGSLQTTSRRRLPTPWSAFVRMLQLHRMFPHSPRFANFDYGDVDVDDENVEFIEAVSGSFMVARKSAVDQVGLLDEAYFMHCEDLDWCKRFALADWKVGFVPSATVVHAKGISSSSRPLAVLWTLHSGMNRFYDKYYQDQYSWLLRWLVKLGIGVSFIARSLIALIRVVYYHGRGIFARATRK